MSGHSKWATIKHKKGALDAKRGKIFTRLIREIAMAAKTGGDPDKNPRLRTAIVAAKAENMPADNIKRAIQRGTGELPGATYEEFQLEGYGPGGVAVLVELSTDNRNRTVSEIRHVFGKHGGNLGEAGSGLELEWSSGCEAGSCAGAKRAIQHHATSDLHRNANGRVRHRDRGGTVSSDPRVRDGYFLDPAEDRAGGEAHVGVVSAGLSGLSESRESPRAVGTVKMDRLQTG